MHCYGLCPLDAIVWPWFWAGIIVAIVAIAIVALLLPKG